MNARKFARQSWVLVALLAICLLVVCCTDAHADSPVPTPAPVSPLSPVPLPNQGDRPRSAVVVVHGEAVNGPTVGDALAAVLIALVVVVGGYLLADHIVNGGR